MTKVHFSKLIRNSVEDIKSLTKIYRNIIFMIVIYTSRWIDQTCIQYISSEHYIIDGLEIIFRNKKSLTPETFVKVCTFRGEIMDAKKQVQAHDPKNATINKTRTK